MGSAIHIVSSSLTFPVLSVAPAYEDDPAYNKQPGPPQTHAGTAGGSPVIRLTIQQLLLFDLNNSITGSVSQNSGKTFTINRIDFKHKRICQLTVSWLASFVNLCKNPYFKTTGVIYVYTTNSSV
ncbi:hypothetical protein XENOCAPTIV_019642 [Xenoophorus captivus]|uniref:Uncharacterized protein n=1 Tax=Xenoophorus captivus TaxID=1517983 RepID=A0ABV0QJ92_9TELE